MNRRLLSLATSGLLLFGHRASDCIAGELPEPIMSADASFSIPLEIEADPDVSEVRLYASPDRGGSWNLAARAMLPIDSLAFRAPGDGEYWFLLKTVDRKGRESDSDPSSPEMRVVVDSVAPRLEVQAERTPSGNVVAAWKVDDPYVVAESLKWSYRTRRDDKWQPISATRAKRQGDDAQAAGQIEWTPPIDDEFVLRAEIGDAAGNSTAQEVNVAARPQTASSEPPAVKEITEAKVTKTAAPPRDPRRPLMVNSKSFELEYDVDRIPATSIGKVEIWGTRDNGRRWVLLGLDDDRRSPALVNVDGEGLYGFAIVAESAEGRSGLAPKSGDEPQIYVGVDLKLPQVRLTTAEPDPEGKPCSLKINWRASDEHLGAQSVSLAYSASAQGPWLPLVVGVANDGGRLCTFDPYGPDNVYLRIEVRDDAGNLGAFSTSSPIPIEKRPTQMQLVGAQREGGSSTPKWFHVLR